MGSISESDFKVHNSNQNTGVFAGVGAGIAFFPLLFLVVDNFVRDRGDEGWTKKYMVGEDKEKSMKKKCVKVGGTMLILAMIFIVAGMLALGFAADNADVHVFVKAAHIHWPLCTLWVIISTMSGLLCYYDRLGFSKLWENETVSNNQEGSDEEGTSEYSSESSYGSSDQEIELESPEVEHCSEVDESPPRKIGEWTAEMVQKALNENINMPYALPYEALAPQEQRERERSDDYEISMRLAKRLQEEELKRSRMPYKHHTIEEEKREAKRIRQEIIANNDYDRRNNVNEAGSYI